MSDRVLALDALGRFGDVRSLLDGWPESFAALAEAIDRAVDDGRFQRDALPADRLDAQVPFEPRAIYAAGANYRAHVIEMIVDRHPQPDKSPEENRVWAAAMMDERARSGTPFFFVKSVGSVTGPDGDIVLPPDAKQPDWELELALVIGRRARHVDRADAFDVIAGYAVANDVSDRGFTFRPDIKELGADWLSSKCSPTYTPFGPYVVPAAFVDEPHALAVKLALNGKLMQDADTSDMIFTIPRLVEYLSSRVELRPGDVVLTGSPQGNGTHYNRYLQPGDAIESSIAGLGTQRNRVVAETEQWQSTVSKLSSTA